MAWPVRSLPVLQQWDCHGCTACCRDYNVYVSDEERARISAQGWEKEPDIGDLPLFVRSGLWWQSRYRLNQRQGHCLFLDADGRCRIHARHGADAKPLACRVFPFVLVPAGEHWRVGLRYSCPSVAANKGRPLVEHQSELTALAAELYRHRGGDGSVLPPPALQGRQRVEWGDLFLFIRTLLALLQRGNDPVERRWRKCLALAALCRQAKFDKISGARLVEFLNLVGDSLDGDVPPAKLVPPPGWVGRILFRQLAAVYLRKDMGTDPGIGSRGRLTLLRAAVQFARGCGPVPRLHGLVPAVTFDRLEEPAGPLPEVAEQHLVRYYTVKVNALQFCGPTNFGLSFWDGLESLAMTLPIILWLSRAFADVPRDEAVLRAVRIVDHNFGFNPLLKGRRQRWALMLLRGGELARLIAWYGR
jgi:lysine-N-methylase